MKPRAPKNQVERQIAEYLSEPDDGGRAPDFAFVGSYIIIASADYDGAPRLTIQPVKEWISKNKELFEDEDE